MATGQADNLVTAAYLACASPVLVAPAMNNHMYEHPATQANLNVLRDRGVHVIEPGTGPLASRGEWGVGRLAEPAAILEAIEMVAGGAPRPLDGMRVLVTAGGTREPLDSVRFVGNRSSGRMGFALAAEAARRGADRDGDRGEHRARLPRPASDTWRCRRPRSCATRRSRASPTWTSC